MRLRNENAYDGDPLHKLLKRLEEVPNARIRVVTNENNELIGNECAIVS